MIRRVHPALLATAAIPCLAGLLAASTSPISTSASVPFLTGLPAYQDGAASAASSQEVTDILDERLTAIQGMDAAAIWSEASRVAGLVGDEFGATFDAVVDEKLGQKSLGAKDILFLATVRLTGENVDHAKIAMRVSEVLKSKDADLVGAATEFLGSMAREISDRDTRKDVAKELLASAENPEGDAKLRVAAAVATNKLGNSPQITAARRVLRSFLASSDPNLRAMGALGFAEISPVEDVDGVEDELDRLAELPGENGRLARAYLEQLRSTRFFESTMRRLREDDSERRLGSDIPQDLERIETMIDVIQKYHLDGSEAKRSDLLEAALQGMLSSLDRHSSFFTPEEYEKFEQNLEAEYGGIGAYVQNDPDDGIFTITRPIYSGPAYEAGLSTDDKIVRIDDWPTIGEETDEIIKRLKGKPGTDVKLYIWRRDMDPTLIDRPTEDMITVIKRAQISIPSVHRELLPGDIGLVELQSFTRGAAIDIASALRDLEQETKGGKLNGVILDLRNNTGGLLDEAAKVSDLFLPKGEVVVRTESRIAESKVFKTQLDEFIPSDTPVAVLINRFSASASEIVSGALQDYGRATLIGQRSFGKGSVQNLLRMPNENDDEYIDENRNHRRDNWENITRDWDGDGEFDFAPRIKLTIERYRLPLGRSIHRELDEEGNIKSLGGLSPDIEVEARRRETWRLREMRRIQDTRVLRKWVLEKFEGNQEEFKKLAFCDFDNPDLYPGFDELYDSLDTTLTRDDVRFLLRIEVRRRVQDTRGSAFPLGDFAEDLQLQAAIENILEKKGTSIQDIPEYAGTFDDRTPLGDAMAEAAPPARRSADEVERAMALIAAAEADGLSKARADELREILKQKN
ncbi:putative CtpA-like serine protease [Planctomycetes bacterium Poly30]|uniref:Putative CtpA-like serine protease n=1 Tax=Saltatorellus ferox TaxID=2528018 RepID=A0A518ERH3_9BACT|nr:putative CtpA-like serine protease [Planctomycetes bacterium Poly30]